MSEHREFTDCWCSPRVYNVDGVGMVVKHRDVEEGWIAGRIFFTEDDDVGWRSDQPFLHYFPGD